MFRTFCGAQMLVIGVPGAGLRIWRARPVARLQRQTCWWRVWLDQLGPLLDQILQG